MSGVRRQEAQSLQTISLNQTTRVMAVPRGNCLPTRGFSACSRRHKYLIVNYLHRLPTIKTISIRHIPGTPNPSWSHSRHRTSPTLRQITLPSQRSCNVREACIFVAHGICRVPRPPCYFSKNTLAMNTAPSPSSIATGKVATGHALARRFLHHRSHVKWLSKPTVAIMPRGQERSLLILGSRWCALQGGGQLVPLDRHFGFQLIGELLR